MKTPSFNDSGAIHRTGSKPKDNWKFELLVERTQRAALFLSVQFRVKRTKQQLVLLSRRDAACFAALANAVKILFNQNSIKATDILRNIQSLMGVQLMAWMSRLVQQDLV